MVCTVLSVTGCGGGGVTSTPAPPPPPVAESISITTNANIQCVETVPFSMVLAAHGNATPVTWSILGGQLPAGLTLDAASGTISGSPRAGQTAVSIQAADAKASSAKQFVFTVFSKLTLTANGSASAHLNAPYSLIVIGSSPIASFSVSAGQLPPGLALTTNRFDPGAATISGMPTQLGTYSFTVQAQDYTVPQTATKNVTIVVDSHLALTKPTLQNGSQNLAYTDAFSAVDGTPPYKWSLSGVLPPGLLFSTSTGRLSGTPTDFGTYLYTVTVSDSSSPMQTDSAQNIFYIAEQLRIFENFGDAFVNQPFSGAFYATGGSFPVTWKIILGNLPPGLQISSDGTLSGTATQLGAYNFTVQATDSGTPPYVVSQAVTLNVTPTPVSVLGDPLSPAPVNVPYHSQIPASGGTPPYTWTISSGALPPGLGLNSSTGSIDGSPTQKGTFNFTAKATDSSNPPLHATANDFILIRGALGRNDSIATASPLGNSGTTSVTFSISPYIDPINASAANPDTDFFRIIGAGGSVVHVETFAQRSSGADPLDSVIEILDQTGARLHTCRQPSYATPCLNDDIDSSTRDSALDLKVPGAANTTTTFYVHVFDWRGDARPDMVYSLNVTGAIDPLTISPTSLGAGATRGVDYQQQFTGAGGSGKITWTLDGGNPPTGWGLSSTGLLSGVATVDGTYTFAIKATDSGNPQQTARVQFTLQIAEPLVITTSPIFPNACVNKPYSFQMQTTGGLPPITFGAGSGTLWVGINVDPVTGLFTGSSPVTGTFTTGAGAVDSAQPPSRAGQQISITVVNCP